MGRGLLTRNRLGRTHFHFRHCPRLRDLWRAGRCSNNFLLRPWNGVFHPLLPISAHLPSYSTRYWHSDSAISSLRHGLLTLPWAWTDVKSTLTPPEAITNCVSFVQELSWSSQQLWRAVAYICMPISKDVCFAHLLFYPISRYPTLTHNRRRWGQTVL